MTTALENSLLDLQPRETAQLLAGIPPLPPVYRELFRRLRDEDVTVHKIAETIEQDPALTQRVLRLVNSAHYGCQQEVTGVRRAVVVLGLRTVQNAALAASIFDRFADEGDEKDEGRTDIARFWEHSIAVAAISRSLAASRLPQQEDEAFVAGLLHDVGKLVELRHFPGDFAHIRGVAADQGLPWYECEGRLFAVDHAQIAAAVLHVWDFPADVVDAIGWHHRPEAAQLAPQLAAIVHVADFLSYGLDKGAPCSPPPLACSRPALDLLGLDEAEQPADEATLRNDIARATELRTLLR